MNCEAAFGRLFLRSTMTAVGTFADEHRKRPLSGVDQKWVCATRSDPSGFATLGEYFQQKWGVEVDSTDWVRNFGQNR